MRKIFTLFFYLLVANFVAAQVVFTATVQKDTMQIGDVNVYKLKITHPADVTIRSIDLKELQVDPLTKERFYQDTSFTNDPQKMAQLDQYFRQQGFSREVMDIQKYGNWATPNESMMLTGSEAEWTTQNTGNQILKENNLQFTFFEEGMHKILPPSIEYEQNGTLRTVTANAVPVQVGSPLPQAAQNLDSLTVEPIKDVMEEPIDLMQDVLIPLGLFLLGTLLLGGLIYFFIKKKPPVTAVVEKPKAYIPPSVVALDKLQKLQAEKIWQTGNIKEYQSQLTYIIREYLENRYDINALENTTSQIMLDLKALNLSEQLRGEVQNILQVADLVKFAKAEPTGEIHEQFMTKAEEFVQTTKKSTAQIEAEKAAIESEYARKLELAQQQAHVEQANQKVDRKSKVKQEKSKTLAVAQKDSYESEVTERGDYKLARLDYRIYAALVDGLFFLLHLMLLVYVGSLPSRLGFENVSTGIQILSLVMGAIVFLSFYFYEPLFGGGPGKLLFGMRVFKENTNQKISIWQSLNRAFLKGRDISLIFSVFSSIKNKKRKLRHDEISKTEVVIKNR